MRAHIRAPSPPTDSKLLTTPMRSCRCAAARSSNPPVGGRCNSLSGSNALSLLLGDLHDCQVLLLLRTRHHQAPPPPGRRRPSAHKRRPQGGADAALPSRCSDGAGRGLQASACDAASHISRRLQLDALAALNRCHKGCTNVTDRAVRPPALLGSRASP